jgi:hypothetical protein
MKRAAAILIVIWTLVMVQPAFAWFGGKSGYRTCSKAPVKNQGCPKTSATTSTCSKKKVTTTDCSTKKCNKPSKSQDKNNCKTEGCNPTLGCSSGNFYVHYHDQISLPSWFVLKQLAVVTDDNRIIKNMSECWHPPKA